MPSLATMTTLRLGDPLLVMRRRLRQLVPFRVRRDHAPAARRVLLRGMQGEARGQAAAARGRHRVDAQAQARGETQRADAAADARRSPPRPHEEIRAAPGGQALSEASQAAGAADAPCGAQASRS